MVVVLLMLLLVVVYVVGFDCVKVVLFIEKMICVNFVLLKFDGELLMVWKWVFV